MKLMLVGNVQNLVLREENSVLAKSKGGRLKHQFHLDKGNTNLVNPRMLMEKKIKILPSIVKKEETQISLKELNQSLDDITTSATEEMNDVLKGNRIRALFIKFNRESLRQDRNRSILNGMREYVQNLFVTQSGIKV